MSVYRSASASERKVVCVGAFRGVSARLDEHEDKEITFSWPDRSALVAALVPCAGKMEIIFRSANVDVDDPEKHLASFKTT